MYRAAGAALAAISFLFLYLPVQADNLSGTVRVIDGDTIWIDETKVRLFGIEAPERYQKCMKDGGLWDCGDWAAKKLRDRFDGAMATCDELGVDGYGRTEAKCWVNGKDLGGFLVAAGAAVADVDYSTDYIELEKVAASNNMGLWQADYHDRDEFRSQFNTTNKVIGDCVIKGNISGGGHIYHLPGQYDYERTQINEHKGERWFCTEAEAIAAGWRAAKR